MVKINKITKSNSRFDFAGHFRMSPNIKNNNNGSVVIVNKTKATKN